MSDSALPDLETGPQTPAPGSPTSGALREASSPDRAAHGHDATCANCGAALQGPFCQACGQHAHVPRTVLHVFEEVVHGITHFDGRVMRSLPMLLFRPGTLTHNYIHGLRARYVPPFAMFLFSVFTMFLVFAFTGGPGFVNLNEDAVTVASEAEVPGAPAAATEASTVTDPVAGARKAVAALEADLAEARQEGNVIRAEAITEGLSVARQVESLAVQQQAAARERAARATDSSAPADADRTWVDGIKDAMRSGDISVSTPWPEFNKKMEAKFQNPDLLLYKFQNTAYKFSFLLIPISLPFLWLMLFWKRGVTLYDHAVFALYSLSFMTLFLVASSLLGPLVPDTVPGTEYLILVPVLHLFFQFKGTYELGWFGAAWRTALFSTIFAWVSLGLFLAAVVALGVID